MAKKTSAMGGVNPFQDARGTAKMVEDQAVPTDKAAPATKEAGKVRMNIYLTREDADLVRDAVYAMGRRYTLGSLITEYLPSILAELEKEHNGGKPFPPRPEEAQNLTSGPPTLLKPLTKREDRA